MSLGKPGEDDVAPSGAPLGSDVRSSVDSILSAEKPKNWSPEFLDVMTHYLGPDVEQLTVGAKVTIGTQNSMYGCVVTDNGLKVETDGKIKGLEFDTFNAGYGLAQTKWHARTSAVKIIAPGGIEEFS